MATLSANRIPVSAGPAYGLAWNPDGIRIAMTGYKDVHVWDSTTSDSGTTLSDGHGSFIWGVSWSPDGRFLASAGENGRVVIWDMDATESVATLITGWAFSVSWSPDGQTLAIGTSDGSIQFWETDTYTQQAVFTGSPSLLLSLDWSPDGTQIAGGQWDGNIRIWMLLLAMQSMYYGKVVVGRM